MYSYMRKMGNFIREKSPERRFSVNQTISNSIRDSQLLVVDFASHQWPIVYHDDYNISFIGIEKLHPFDSGKWGRIVQFLIESKMLTRSEIVTPKEATENDLLVVHTKSYIDSLKWSGNVALITEVPPVALLPNILVQQKVLRPLRLQTGGAVAAGKLAIERGWAINVGGGFHHCYSTNGGGFCAYADITLCIKFVMASFKKVKKVLIIDLDAHQGNGHERDFMEDENVFILDIYNREIYPFDGYAKRAIGRKVELVSGTPDETYLPLVEKNVNEVINEFVPDFIVYNAGTDILVHDPLGNLDISPKGVIERDRLVFAAARSHNIPIVMLTSGGYQRTTARVIADSILSLKNFDLIKNSGG